METNLFAMLSRYNQTNPISLAPSLLGGIVAASEGYFSSKTPLPLQNKGPKGQIAPVIGTKGFRPLKSNPALFKGPSRQSCQPIKITTSDLFQTQPGGVKGHKTHARPARHPGVISSGRAYLCQRGICQKCLKTASLKTGQEAVLETSSRNQCHLRQLGRYVPAYTPQKAHHHPVRRSHPLGQAFPPPQINRGPHGL